MNTLRCRKLIGRLLGGDAGIELSADVLDELGFTVRRSPPGHWKMQNRDGSWRLVPNLASDLDAALSVAKQAWPDAMLSISLSGAGVSVIMVDGTAHAVTRTPASWSVAAALAATLLDLAAQGAPIALDAAAA